MNFAQIKDGVIKNIIFLKDESLIPLFSQDFDYFLRVDDLDQEPHMGDLYDGVKFIKFTPKLDIQIVTQGKIQAAMDGFNDIQVKYVAINVLAGITQAGKTRLIADALQDVMRYGQSGSLYAAISALQSIQLTQDMDPFLTPAVIADLIQQAKSLLASL